MASDTPADVTAKIVSAFKIFDVDGNGTISKEELLAILMRPSASGKTFTPEEVDQLFSSIDADGSGGVDYTEFAAAWASKLAPLALEITFPAGTPADTQLAIRSEVSRQRRLPPAELAMLGGKYTDAEALWVALDALDGNATLILRGSYLKKQRGGWLPKRGTTLPPDAVITVKELREIHAKSKAKHALPVIALSQSVARPSNPPKRRRSMSSLMRASPSLALVPAGSLAPAASGAPRRIRTPTARRSSVQRQPSSRPLLCTCAESPCRGPLRLVIDALEESWSRFEDEGVSDMGILIDWCGLYQAPRDDEQQRVFGAALKAINQVGAQPRPSAHTLGTGHRPHSDCSHACTRTRLHHTST